jgi:glycosyltransferase involved in cell wall biosynthesis
VRCLLLSPFVPSPPHDGGRLRVLELARGLERAHDVELLALSTGSNDDRRGVEALRGEGLRVEAVEHRPHRARAAARALAARRSLYGELHRSEVMAEAVRRRLPGVDVVQAEFSYMGAYRPPGGGGPPWVLDEHNVEFRLNETLARAGQGAAYRVYARRERRLRRAEELAACRAADRVLAVSDADREALERELPGVRVAVVPNGVDLEALRAEPLPPSDAAPTGVFVGKMDYRPNVDGARWLCDEVLPHIRERVPSFRVAIVGRDPAPSVASLGRVDGVEVTGAVADVRPHLRGAALALVPLRAGSGTRLKVLEAMAAGRPVVSTSLGAEGIEARDGEHLLLADDARSFADAAVRVAGDRTLAERLAASGRRLVEERYGWPAAVARLERVHSELVAREPQGAAP